MKNDVEEFNFRERAAYYTLLGIWHSLSKMPMWLLYTLSNILYIIIYYIVRYRRKVVRKNLGNSFPEKILFERLYIEKKFYLNFCDVLVESLKYLSISEKQLKKRMKFFGLEQIEGSCRQGRSCAVYIGHYANWEWISSLPLWLSTDYGRCVQLYHPLENKIIDRLIGYTRERIGATSIPVNESIRLMMRLKNEGKPIVVGFIADQVPLWNNIHFWTTFLHQETPMFTGTERIARKLDMDVYYFEVKRVKRGYYEVETKLMTRNPKELPETKLTQMYSEMLEANIRKAPAYWLWSHNRWKRTKEKWLERLSQQADNKKKKNFQDIQDIPTQ